MSGDDAKRLDAALADMGRAITFRAASRGARAPAAEGPAAPPVERPAPAAPPPPPPAEPAPAAPAGEDRRIGPDAPGLYPVFLGMKRPGWIPLHIDALLSSRLVAGAIVEDRFDALGVAMLTWASAVRQDPPGTLPVEPGEQAHAVGLGRDLATWAALVERGALRGWSETVCVDRAGRREERRLAHGFLTPLVVEAVELIQRRIHASRRAAERSVLSRIRRPLQAAGFNPLLVKQTGFLRAVRAELEERGETISEETAIPAAEAVSAWYEPLRGAVPLRSRPGS